MSDTSLAMIEPELEPFDDPPHEAFAIDMNSEVDILTCCITYPIPHRTAAFNTARRDARLDASFGF